MKLTLLFLSLLLFLSSVSMATEIGEDDEEIDYTSIIGSAIKRHIEKHAHKIYKDHVPSMKETVDFWMGSEEDITIEQAESSSSSEQQTKKNQGGTKHYIALIVLLIALLLMLALLLCFCAMIQRVAIYVVWLLMIMVIIFLFITLGAFVSAQYDWFTNTAFYGNSP